MAPNCQPVDCQRITNEETSAVLDNVSSTREVEVTRNKLIKKLKTNSLSEKDFPDSSLSKDWHLSSSSTFNPLTYSAL